jgi:hypothetical protein
MVYESASCVSLVFPYIAYVFLLMRALGQLYTKSVSETVTERAGAVVPNTKVTVTEVGRGFTFEAVTDESDNFVASNLPPARPEMDRHRWLREHIRGEKLQTTRRPLLAPKL